MNQDYHLFNGKRVNVDQIFKRSFAHESISVLQYRSTLNENFKFNVKFALNPPNLLEGESSIKDDLSKNLGKGIFLTKHEQYQLKQKVDTNQIFENHFYYRFKISDPLIFYWKLQAKTNNLTKNTVGLSYQPFDYLVSRLQADIKNLSLQIAIKGEYVDEQEKRKSGAAVSILYKERLLRMEKFFTWHSFDGIDICGGIGKQGKFDFALFKKFSEQKQLAYEIVFQPSGVQCQYEKIMRFALLSKLNDNVSVVAKVDNDFKGQIALLYKFDERTQLVVINKLDLDIRQNKQRKIIFPIALKFVFGQE